MMQLNALSKRMYLPIVNCRWCNHLGNLFSSIVRCAPIHLSNVSFEKCFVFPKFSDQNYFFFRIYGKNWLNFFLSIYSLYCESIFVFNYLTVILLYFIIFYQLLINIRVNLWFDTTTNERRVNEIGEKRKRDLLVDSLKLSFFKCCIPSRKNS